MLSKIIKSVSFFLSVCLFVSVNAQQETECDPTANLPITQGEVNFNYGSVTNSFSFRNRSSYTVAQSVVGSGIAKDYTAQSGFWSRFLLPPQAPQVESSQGDFPDRVLINWNLDPLSSEATDGYVITRDGAFLAQVDRGITQYIDFNVLAGEFYDYRVYGRNQFGNGTTGLAIGFVNPNGIVTGKIETVSGNPVAGTIVSLSPSIGNSLLFDGIDDYLCVTHTPEIPTNMFTASAWIKIGATHDSDGIMDLGSDLHKNFWIHTTPSGSAKGVVIGVGDGFVDHEIAYEFTSDPDGWHQVTAVYSGGSLILYVDGKFASSIQANIMSETALFSIGCRRDQSGYFDGWIDDVRIYNKPLNGTEIFLSKDITVSKNTPGLVAYWKFDEGVGSKVFDISNNNIDAAIRGAHFSPVTPAIKNSGLSDASGFYAIEGVNYSEAETFTATPSKIFYSKFALEFNSAYDAYATLTDFDLPDTATVDVILHPFDIQSRQSVLSNGNGDFELFIELGSLKLTLNGETQNLGPITSAYHHVSLTLDAASGEVKYHSNGVLLNSLTYSSVNGDWSGSPWQIAAKNTVPTDFYTGLIDEVVFYKKVLSLSDIQLNASTIGAGGTNIGHPDLLSYFTLDEGTGTALEDAGASMTGFGTMHNAFFSIITYNQTEVAHDFRPSQRLVNINSSNTAASGIDFIDESTLTVTGVVRFSGTFCYQDSVEILVDGESAFPAIYTDEEGRFVADFEPGITAKLTPKFADHKFSPGFYEVKRLNRPIAGVLFQNLTKREIVGQMAGGLCRKSVIPLGAIVVVKVQALNDCFSIQDTLENADGKFSFTGIPPIPVSVAVVQHSNNNIYEFFNTKGGPEIDLRIKAKDTVDFIYIAPPQVYIQPFTENGCTGESVKIIEQSSPKNGYREYQSNIRVYEEYDGGLCYLDTFHLTIENDIEDQPAFEIDVDSSVFVYKYYAGQPNLGAGHLKFLQVTAEVNGSAASNVEYAIVVGERSREATFTTASPSMPLIILRDPPGDGSNAVITKGTTHCQTWSEGNITDTDSGEKLNFDLGPKIITYMGSPFSGVITEMEGTNEEDFTATFTSKEGETSNAEVCVTIDKEYSTSANDAVIGEDADIYVGAAVNFEFSATDLLSYDPDSCAFFITQNVRVNPKSFGTKYIYSEFQIENDVIPSLETDLMDTVSANAWRNIIQYNKDLKKSAVYRENISFDALSKYSEKFESKSTNSYEFSWDLGWTLAMNTTLGFEVMNVGSTVTISNKVGGNYTNTEGESNSETRATTYTLEDNDVGDNFTIDILDDPVFGTPVFKLKSGESMCPWENGTLNREEVGFSVNRLTAVNIPENEAAVFKVKMTNNGQTGVDQLVYSIGKVAGSNPDAAYIQIDGAEFVDPLEVQLGPFKTKDFLIAVSKGPVEFSYNNLGIFMASTCQIEHSRNLGYALSGAYSDPDAPFQGQYKTEDLDKFYKEYRLNVEFLEPCSPIDISFPMQDWVVTPADGESQFITLNNYIYNDPDLEVVRLQYRRTGGDGAWLNIIELPAAEFANAPVFKNVPWDMSLLADGPYDLRAITQCFDVSLPPGISHVIKGRKETKPPKLYGEPQPADGVLSPGDEISIEFSKRINCIQVYQADGIGTNINLNNIALLDMTEGGILIDAIITCKEDKIVIVPNIANQYIENHVLRAVATDIKDLYGNPIEQVIWEFYVNRSNLYWVGGDIDEVVIEGNELIVKREIRNQSGEVTNFTISEFPIWMDIFPTSGTLQPGAIQTVQFKFPNDLINNPYAATIFMESVDGEEPINVNLRVACPPPDWDLNPSDYSFSMNMTAELNIEGAVSNDKLDKIGAFVDGKLRGVGTIQYDSDLKKYLAFLSIYSNVAVGETIQFQIWDASTCQLYGIAVENFPFEADGIIGSPLVPQVIHTNNQLLRKIYIHSGWNWLSFNLNLLNPDVNGALTSLTNPAGGLIKNQSSFSAYSNTSELWYGPLDSITYTSLYQFNSLALDSISMIGAPVDIGTPIPLTSGWNWIGYLPQAGQTVTKALASISPLNGDLIKGQLSFAQFVAGLGWIGNLKFLNAPNGYLLKLSGIDTLIYPDPSNVRGEIISNNRNIDPTLDASKTTIDATDQLLMPYSYWQIDPTKFEHSMNVIAVVVNGDSENMLADGDEVAAFVGGEVRGSGEVIYIQGLDVHMLFLTTYANKEGELMTFKYFDSSDSTVYDIEENTAFKINSLWGGVDNPAFLHLAQVSGTSEIDITSSRLEVYPNPFAQSIFLNYYSNDREDITVKYIDAYGKIIETRQIQVKRGLNVIEWKPNPSVALGTYFVNINSSNSLLIEKVLYIK